MRRAIPTSSARPTPLVVRHTRTCRWRSRGRSTPSEIVIVGGHYDSVAGCPGANDNASGTAAVLALARLFATSAPARTLRFAAFTNEEPPHFQTDAMGSRVCALNCRARSENVVAMLSLETIGFYSDAEGSQSYPPPFSLFYPSKGNFIAFVGNVGSRGLVRRAIRTFRERTPFPSEGAALPGFVPGVGWSDHWSFWREGYQAIMVTDTAPFRYPHYHTARPTPLTRSTTSAAAASSTAYAKSWPTQRLRGALTIDVPRHSRSGSETGDITGTGLADRQRRRPRVGLRAFTSPGRLPDGLFHEDA